MKTLLTLMLPLVILLGACQVESEPINFGKDSCHHCKMTIMDPKFGSQVVTTKGRVYNFDDINCIHQFIKESSMKQEDIKHLMVIDFAQPQKLIDAKTAFYVRSEEIRSPMASNLAAFKTEAAAMDMLQKWEGEALSYDKVKVQWD
jgi:copper chaperone NosL